MVGGMADPTQIMRAVKTGIVKDGPNGRTVIRRGESTAQAGHPIVTGHPHLWAPIRPDFPVEGGEVGAGTSPVERRDVQALSAAGIVWAEEIRRLAAGLADRGYVVEGVEPDDPTLPARVVDLALSVAEGASLANHPPVPSRVLARDEPCQDPEHCDVHAPQGPVGTEPGCTHPDCILDHPHDGPAELATDAAVTRATVTEQDVPARDETPADPSTKEGRKAIREWAVGEGIEVAATGPLPADVLSQYEASFAEPEEFEGAEDHD